MTEVKTEEFKSYDLKIDSNPECFGNHTRSLRCGTCRAHTACKANPNKAKAKQKTDIEKLADKAEKDLFNLITRMKTLRSEIEELKKLLPAGIIAGDDVNEMINDISRKELELKACEDAETSVSVKRRRATDLLKGEAAKTLADKAMKQYIDTYEPIIREGLAEMFKYRESEVLSKYGSGDLIASPFPETVKQGVKFANLDLIICGISAKMERSGVFVV